MVLEFLQESGAGVLAVMAVIAGFLTYFRKIRENLLDFAEYLRGRSASGVPEETLWPVELSAKFASGRGDIPFVLDLRKRVFRDVLNKEVISGDDTYWDAYDRNKFSFSLVSEEGLPFGYWGMIPVGKQDFEKFLEGGLTHAQMLTEASIAWEDADPQNLYLYYVGAVVLRKEYLAEGEPELHNMEYKTLLDSIVVGYGLSKRAAIKGIAVYASTGYGWKICERQLLAHGFEETGVFADTDRVTEILVLKEDNVDSFFDTMRAKHIDPHMKSTKKGRLAAVSTWMQRVTHRPEKSATQPTRDLRESAIMAQLVRKVPKF
ncbi:MAG: hypothetical protein ACU0BB_14725 [Paracoccaceae bacterium]